jgi:hypothetical protein
LRQVAQIDLSFRVGAALLATAAVAAIGLLLGALFLYAGWSQSIGGPVVSGAVAGALSGALLPVGAMDFVEGTVHFFIGFFVASAAAAIDDVPSGLFRRSAERPEWLHWVFVFGAFFALVLWVVPHL